MDFLGKQRFNLIWFGIGVLTANLLSQFMRTNSYVTHTVPRCPPPTFVPQTSTITEKQIPKEDTNSEIKSMQDQIDYGGVMMDTMEVDLVLKYLKNAKTYLEWGSGGSTLNYGKFPTQRVVSIEHHKEWCDKMPGLLRQAKLDDKVEYHCVPVNHQDSEGRYWQYRPYVNEIEHLNQTTWDFVLVDGRARVSCAIKTLSYLHDKSVVVVHDFERVTYSGGDDYSLIFEYYDVLERVGDTVKYGQGKRGLGVLRRKEKFDYLQGNTPQVQTMLDELSSRNKI